MHQLFLIVIFPIHKFVNKIISVSKKRSRNVITSDTHQFDLFCTFSYVYFHIFDLLCTSNSLLRPLYFDILSNLDFLLVEKYNSKYSFRRSKVCQIWTSYWSRSTTPSTVFVEVKFG